MTATDAQRLSRAGIVTVLLADDHPVVREGVASVLRTDPEIRVLGQAGSAEEAIRMTADLRPDVLVMDVRLGEMDGIEACAHLKTAHPGVKVVLLTQFAHEAVMLRAFRAGALGFVVKSSDPTAVLEAVHTAAEGRTYIDAAVAARLVGVALDGRRAHGPFGLTMQEMRVLELLPKGLSNQGIADEMALSLETVKTHLRNAMQKLQVTDRTEAAAIAVREGLA